METNPEVTANEGRYLKFLYRRQKEQPGRVGTTVIAAFLGIKPASVTEVLQKLAEKGLLRYRPYQAVNLTEKGIIKAKNLLRKHRILEILFVKFLNYDFQKACEEAAGLDYYISEELANAICQAYGHPEVCPCDKPIFRNIECCEMYTSNLNEKNCE